LERQPAVYPPDDASRQGEVGEAFAAFERAATLGCRRRDLMEEPRVQTVTADPRWAPLLERVRED
jgi:hypothetical protein